MKLFKIFTKEKEEPIKCNRCETEYNGILLCFGSELPDYYYAIPPNEIKERVELEKSLCVIDKTHFFHRGRVTIPIIDFKEDLYFDIWTSISQENFKIRMDCWNSENRKDFGPYFGWIQNQIPTYENTINIKSIAIEQDAGVIPEIEITEENHQLAIDQKNGITYQKAMEIVKFISQSNNK
ncbi:DUF2199 domain-containing protein [Tenacibaculum aiptasiae]|uniref:DUF2199 domain-containing protein n=1 Tax=Tenacibaculum aiptasiae TaxID=426481 RepID=A0A7J5AEI3_9FLAO|nr:DUF2199 domain-containing protein [Tenacibaculum aiptasiae]KAB1155945.1 DUF2199 domain-containing protein [Tenacibaculum aiptasiae]